MSARDILRDADTLAAELWRVPPDDQPAYKRAINRLLSLITGVLVMGALFVSPARGQSADSLLATRIRADLDSIARDRTAPKYTQRAVTRGRARADSILALHKTPPLDTTPPPPPPPPPDTSTTIAEPPRVYVTTTYPAAVRRWPIMAGADLQQALDAAVAGDELVLAAGATFTGNFVWTRCLAGWVTIVGGTGTAEGVQMTPTLAAPLAKLVSPNVAPVILAKQGACKLRLSRVEITATAQSSTVNYNYGLVRLGEDETTLAAQPSEIVLDRVYLHGTATTSTQNGVIFNGRSLAVIDSWISEVHWPATETHCIVGWSGAGPFKIVNNTLSCASINILFGGATPAIADVYPADVEIRRNHILKDPAWKGQGYGAKNLIEFKFGRRFLVEGNVLERSWSEAQEGMAINAQSLGDTPTTLTADVIFRWNRISAANQCFVFSARGFNGVASPMARVAVEQNLCTEIGGDQTNRAILMTADLQGVLVRHNTFIRNRVPGGPAIYIDRVGGAQASRVDFLDNLIGPGSGYPCLFGEGKSGSAQLTYYAAAWSFLGNGCWESYLDGSVFPVGNLFADTQTAVGFAPDWSLGTASPWKGKASDGKDPGVDMAELARRTAGVVVLP